MKAFRFPLEGVLRYRFTQLEVEELKLTELFYERTWIDQEIRGLKNSVVEAAAGIHSAAYVDAVDLRSLAAFHLRVRKRIGMLTVQRSENESRIAAQQQVLTEARRAFRLVEKLKQRRLDAWKLELNKETDTIAADAYIARWNRAG